MDEAQDLFRLLGARASDLDVECGLLHSRFTRTDREKNETYWVNLYGKNGFQRRCEKGRILVGTQVLEQSLDIDGDFLISRMAGHQETSADYLLYYDPVLGYISQNKISPQKSC